MSSARWIPLAVWLVASGVVMSGSALLRSAETESAREHVGVVADQASRRLEDLIRGRLLVLEVVRTEIAAGLIRDQAAFVERTGSLQQEFRGFQAINWIDRDHIIRWISPEGPNRSARGRNVLDSPLAAPAIRAARADGRPRLSPPLDLFQGGRGVTSYFPVEVDGEIVGFVNGVFMTDPLIEESLRGGILDAFEVLIGDGEELVYGSPESFGAAARDRVRTQGDVSVLSRNWTIALAPRAATWHALQGPSHAAYVIAGLLLSTALAFVLRVALQRQAQREQAVHERRRVEAQLHQSQKMEAIGQLAGGVAHDFNNLLTAMLGNADLILASESLEKDEREALEQIVLASERASMLTSQLLTFSRRQIVQPRTLDPNVEIEVLRPMLERLVRDDVTLEFELEPRIGSIEMDPGQFSQVLINLVVNAMDALPEGGRILVTTRNAPPEPGVRDEPQVLVVVADTGEGMSAETRARALEPFFTTKPPGEGTGLGLSTVYGIVTAAGGTVDLRSALGEGTRIEVALPEVARAFAHEDVDGGTPVRGGGARVLVVEDEPSVLRVTARMLEQAGFEVLTASNGRDALRRLEHAGPVELVVTDAVMPEMGGLDLLRRLRADGAECGAVLCSGYAEEIDQAELESLGALFVRKPYTPNAMLDAVGRVFASSDGGVERS